MQILGSTMPDGQTLHSLVAGARWFDRQHHRITAAGVYDSVRIGRSGDPLILLIASIATEGDPVALYFIPAVQDADGGLTDAAAQSRYHAQAIGRLLAAGVIETDRGNCIRLDAAPGRHLDPRRLEPLGSVEGTSTNAVTRISVGGQPCLHKVYRRLDARNHEAALVRLLGGEDAAALVPACVFSYRYVDRRVGAVYPLGLVCEFFDGIGIDRVLSENIKRLWPRVRGGAPADWSAVGLHLRPLASLLEGAGGFLHGFHAVLGRRLQPLAPGEGIAFDTTRFAAAVLRRGARLLSWINRDPSLPAWARARIADALARGLPRLCRAASEAAPSGVPAGFGHGDLHLSHLLVRSHGKEEGGEGWAMRVVDLSIACVDRAEADFPLQTPLQDLVAFQRGLEYFASDEVLDEVAAVAGLTEDDAARARLLDRLDAGRAADPAIRRDSALGEQAARLLTAADAWCRSVFGTVRQGYTAGSGRSPPSTPLWTLLYLDRLFHELEYNFRHARNRFRYMDYYYLYKKISVT